MDDVNPRGPTASPGRELPSTPRRSLVSAALAGLLSAGAAACDGGGEDSPPGKVCGEGEITSTRIVRDMTLERFTEDCEDLDGQVEEHASCGGVNSCAGLSYDDETFELTEHTCCGLNTCSGYSCVLDPV